MQCFTTMTAIFLAIALVGMVCLVFQIYRMVRIDATARGLKHPKFWGIFSIGGNNGGGLLLYLIGRRKYPIIVMTEDDKAELARRKKASGVALVFLVVGMIGVVLCIAKYL